MKEKLGRFVIDLEAALDDKGNLDAKKCHSIYLETVKRICLEASDASNSEKKEYFDFLSDLSDLKDIELAKYLGATRGQVSEWKRAEKGISNSTWGLIRIFFYEYLINGVIHPVLETKAV